MGTNGFGSTLRFLVSVFLLFLVGLIKCESSWSFPEFIRHGYVNCIACHVSPSGGGVLTRYGREISRESLSTWGKDEKKFSNFAFGALKPPKWMNVMGMYRSTLAHQNTPYISQTQYIFMQNDIEMAATFKKLYLVASAGYQNMANEQTVLDHLISRTHFIGYWFTDTLSLRAGKFFPAFGINTPDHVIPTKKDLGWDQGQETYNVEAAWVGDAANLYVTGILGRPDQPSLNREQGVSVVPSLLLGDTYKVGATYYYGKGAMTTRNVEGSWAVLGFTPRFFLRSELDFQQRINKIGSNTQSGLVNYQRLDYELVQGFHVFGTQGFSRLDFSDAQSSSNFFGLGLQFFPISHIELYFEWQKLKTIAVSDQYTDLAWLMVQVYL